MEERPGAGEHGKRSRRRGGRKQTCYDFDDGATQAVNQGGVMEEGGATMKNKHKEIKTHKKYLNIENNRQIKYTTTGHTY